MKVKVKYVLTETWVEEYDSLAVAIEDVTEKVNFYRDNAEMCNRDNSELCGTTLEGNILSIEDDGPPPMCETCGDASEFKWGSHWTCKAHYPKEDIRGNQSNER